MYIVHILVERCKGCKICVDFCPPKILFLSNRQNSSGYVVVDISDATKCIGCKLCENYCPDFAIYIEQKK